MHPWETQIYLLKTKRVVVYWLLGEYLPAGLFRFRREGKWGMARVYRLVIIWDFFPRVLFHD